MQSVTMETSIKVDLTKVKQEPMEVCVKIENLPEKDNSFQSKLDSINKDMIQYESRDFPSVKIKREPSLCRNHTLINYEEQQTEIKLNIEEVTKDNVVKTEISESNAQKLETPAPDKIPLMETPAPDKITLMGTPAPDKIPLMETPAPDKIPLMETPAPDKIPLMETPAPDKIPLTTETGHHKEHAHDTWTPIPLSELVGFYGNSDTSNWSLDLNDSNISEINGQSVKERTSTNFSTYEENRNTAKRTANSERQVFLQENEQLIVQTTDSSRNKYDHDMQKPRESIKRTIVSGSTSTTFKDPNKVLDQGSYIYRKKRNLPKDINRKTFDDFNDTSIYAETLKQSMEKKQLIFINKRTKQRRETFLTYFDDFGIEAIIASYKGTDKLEMYNRSEDPNTFYRLFYNFTKTSSNEPKPQVSDKEVQAVSKYMKEYTKQQEKNADNSSKRPRLTPAEQPNKNSEVAIIRSTRQLRKLGRGFATENYYKRYEENQSRHKSEPRNSYWASRGKRNNDININN